MSWCGWYQVDKAGATDIGAALAPDDVVGFEPVLSSRLVGRTRSALCAGLILIVVAGARAGAAENEDRPAACGTRAPFAIQILGSGGPELQGGRASAAYVVWVQGRARVLIDLGGGSYLRFGEVGAALEDLWHVGLTHLHVDHSADLVVLVKAAYFSQRSAPLSISGPAGAGPFPSFDDWLQRLFGVTGAYAYLGGVLDGSGGQFALQPVVADATPGARAVIFDEGGVTVEAIGVRHGRIPALSYRVSALGHTAVFTGDQDGMTGTFWDAARDADILVAHLAISDDTDRVAMQLHATPERIAQGAARTHVRHLVLSHLMQRTLEGIDNANVAIAAGYDGRVTLARDRACVVVD